MELSWYMCLFLKELTIAKLSNYFDLFESNISIIDLFRLRAIYWKTMAPYKISNHARRILMRIY